MGSLTFVTGGARSGKSRQAEMLAAATGAPVVYLATMEPLDEELERRVALHRTRRPGDWTTAEEPLALGAALAGLDTGATVLLDCVSLWVSNLLFATVPDIAAAGVADWDRVVERALREATEILAIQRERHGTMVAVSNEVGSGIVPGEAVSRCYRDALGLVNQSFAMASDEAYLLVSGLPLRLR